MAYNRISSKCTVIYLCLWELGDLAVVRSHNETSVLNPARGRGLEKGPFCFEGRSAASLGC